MSRKLRTRDRTSADAFLARRPWSYASASPPKLVRPDVRLLITGSHARVRTAHDRSDVPVPKEFDDSIANRDQGVGGDLLNTSDGGRRMKAKVDVGSACGHSHVMTLGGKERSMGDRRGRRRSPIGCRIMPESYGAIPANDFWRELRRPFDSAGPPKPPGAFCVDRPTNRPSSPETPPRRDRWSGRRDHPGRDGMAADGLRRPRATLRLPPTAPRIRAIQSRIAEQIPETEQDDHTDPNDASSRPRRANRRYSSSVARRFHGGCHAGT